MLKELGKMIKGYSYKTRVGELTILENDGFLVEIAFGKSSEKPYRKEETSIVKSAYRQIEDYLNGKRKSFDLPLKPEGTEFQRLVWAALLDIPHGQTRSYQEVAEKIGRPKAYRAVGLANNKNPLPIIIPCHRVIGKDGKMVGYAGGLDIKEKLLSVEAIIEKNQRSR